MKRLLNNKTFLIIVGVLIAISVIWALLNCISGFIDIDFNIRVKGGYI